MDRVGVVLVLVAAGCGRIDFSPRDLDAAGAGDAPASARWSRVVAYGNQTCGVFVGAVYCWGKNDLGQLGDGTTTNQPAPRAVMLPAGPVDDLTLGQDQGCAIVAGTLHCWGSLGTPAPQVVTLPARATAVSAGRNYTCVVASGVHCWGLNDVGQLGIGTMAFRSTPTPLSWTGRPLVAVDAGDDHACALDDQKHAHCWGHNDYGTLGAGVGIGSALTPLDVPASVQGLPRIAGWHACAVTNGAVDCWGQGANGELGDGLVTDRGLPGPVPALASGVTALETGGGPGDPDASCAIQGGLVHCWGDGRFGRLGDGGTAQQNTPVPVMGLPGGATAIALGWGHACAIVGAGDLWCWGQGTSGELGQGAMASSSQPVAVQDP